MSLPCLEFLLWWTLAGTPENIMLEPAPRFLRAGLQPEWTEFAGRPVEPKLDISFEAHGNAAEWTLRLRQRDVKAKWDLFLNGRLLGSLTRDENSLLSCLSVPPGTLRPGRNHLGLIPEESSEDDIEVSDLVLERKPVEALLTEAGLEVAIVDADTGAPLPSRLTIVDERGFLVPFGVRSPLAVSTGIAYSAEGLFRLSLPMGNYRIFGGRGMEYGVDTDFVRLQAGRSEFRRLSIRRQLTTPGWVSVDTHTHTFTYSRHGTASVEDRVLSLAGEGVEMPIATDHDVLTDYEPVAVKMGVRRYFTPVTGAEITTQIGHFNIFPVQSGARLPDKTLASWPVLFDSIWKTPGVQVVILNHPRDLHGRFRPFDDLVFDWETGETRLGWRLQANAVEVVNSGALRSDPLQLILDWLGLLNRGYRLAPIGSSDSHDVGRKLVGQARTYVSCPDQHPESVDVAAAVANLKAGRVIVSMGLFPEIRVQSAFGPGDLVTAPEEVEVRVRVSGPDWVTAERVLLFANAELIREAVLSKEEGHRAGLKAEYTWLIQNLPRDCHLVAVALGPGVEQPFWRIPRPYQPSTPDWRSYVVGCTGAVWVDADGDGSFTPTPR